MFKVEDARELRKRATRRDLLSQLFPLSISVGLGFSLTALLEVENADAALSIIGFVFASLVIAISGWESYFIEGQPQHLGKKTYYFIDLTVALLFSVMLISTRVPDLWLLPVVAIFLLYAARDGIEFFDAGVPRKKSNWLNSASMFVAFAVFLVLFVVQAPHKVTVLTCTVVAISMYRDNLIERDRSTWARKAIISAAMVALFFISYLFLQTFFAYFGVG